MVASTKQVSVGLSINGVSATNPEVAVAALKQRNETRKKALTQYNTPLTKASIFLDRWVQTNFRTEGANVGGWAPFALGGRLLSDGSIDGSAKLLRKSGRLAASFSPFATSKTAGVFSDLDYSGNHHEGIGVTKRRLLPERVEVVKDIRRILKGEIATAVSKVRGAKSVR